MGGAFNGFALFFIYMPEQKDKLSPMDILLMKLRDEKFKANEVQRRRHEEWNDNYSLYRHKTKTNRLTQRQAVTIPLMKETVKTLLSKIDDAPHVEWKELGGDEDKEILMQELWEEGFKENKLELHDILDKKNVLLYGIGPSKLNITDTGVSIESLDVYDLVYDPLMMTSDIETARYIVHQNIFRTIEEVTTDDRYLAKGKKDLENWINSAPGIVHGGENRIRFQRKMQRIKDVTHESMGTYEGTDYTNYAGGDRLINLTEHFTNVWNTKEKKFERRVYVYADDHILLLDEKLEDLTGVDFYPFAVWGEDPESTDIYSDSVADLVRVPNKIINVWYSQLVENRTLKNFQMHWFSPVQGYQAQTYTPGAGVMIPAPPGDDINKVIKPVEISGLDDTLVAIEALTNIVERGSGATAIEKGEGEAGSQTLGEIEILVGKAMERTVGMAKFYRMSWYEKAWKWLKLMEKNSPKVTKLYKTGRSGKIYTKKIMASDWQSKEGYEPIIRSSSEQERDNIKTIQKFQFLMQQFPENQAIKEIAKRRMLESVDLSPDELRQVEDAETIQNRPTTPQTQPGQAQAQQQGAPQDTEEQQLLGEIDQLTAELG